MDANRHLLRSDYEARTSDELPVLVRWFEGVEPPVAEYLIAILYSREQLAKEGTLIAADWGVRTAARRFLPRLAVDARRRFTSRLQAPASPDPRLLPASRRHRGPAHRG